MKGVGPSETAAEVLARQFSPRYRMLNRDPDPEPADHETEPEAVDLTLRLLVAIAEDPMVRASHRIAARPHLPRLQERTG